MSESDVHFREGIGKASCGYEVHALDELQRMRYTWNELNVTCPECIVAYDPPLRARAAAR